MLQQAYGDSFMSMPTFCHWYNAFRDNWESVVDEQWEEWPSAACNEVLQSIIVVIVREDWRITVCELAQCLKISVGSAFAILHDDLQMRLVSCRWVLCLLTQEQMAHHVAVCNKLYTQFQSEGETKFRNVINLDEYRMFHYSPESK